MATTAAETTERTTTVRISAQTHETLRQLSHDLGQPMSQVLETAVEKLRRQVFLEKANEEYARLRADPEAWAEELAERELLAGTLKDGLEPEEWTDDDFIQTGPR